MCHDTRRCYLLKDHYCPHVQCLKYAQYSPYLVSIWKRGKTAEMQNGVTDTVLENPP